MDLAITNARIISALERVGLTAHTEHHETIDSTSARAAQLIKSGRWIGTQPLLICANYQSAGRGRRGRIWHASMGQSLMFTWAERADQWAGEGALIPLAGALAVTNALASLYSIKAGIKWPNDVRINGLKLAGILAEQAHGPNGTALLIGIGINIHPWGEDFPNELRETSTFATAHTSETIDRPCLMATILQALHQLKREVREHGGKTLRPRIVRRLDMIGKMIRIEHENAPPLIGAAMGIESNGALIVRQMNGESVVCLSGIVYE